MMTSARSPRAVAAPFPHGGAAATVPLVPPGGTVVLSGPALAVLALVAAHDGASPEAFVTRAVLARAEAIGLPGLADAMAFHPVENVATGSDSESPADSMTGEASRTAGVLDARERAREIAHAGRRAERLAKARRAHEDVILAIRRARADGLEIEALAERRLVDEYEAAQARGEVAKGSVRTDIVPHENDVRPATAAEIGLNRKDIHEGRKTRSALEADPHAVRRALDDMLEAGDEPTRAALKRALAPVARKLGMVKTNMRAAVGSDSATKAERGDNLYQTPVEAMRVLLAVEAFSPRVSEPACGRGAIARVMEDAGYEVTLADLVDYGTHDRHGELQRVEDFLASAPSGRRDIVTNPPYGPALNAFIGHALRVHKPHKLALLLNLNVLCGSEDEDRNFALDVCRPARIHIFSRRLPMMHRDGWDGPEASSRMNAAWFVWEKDRHGGYAGAGAYRRHDWKDYIDRAPLPPRDTAAPAAPLGPVLDWRQERDGGRILAMTGAVEFGAVFPNEDGSCEWSVWLGEDVVSNKRAKSVDAGKSALSKAWTAFLKRAQLDCTREAAE